MIFALLQVGTQTILCPVWATSFVSSDPLRKFFSKTWVVSPHTDNSMISYQLKTRGSHSADIQGFLSVQLSPLRYCALGVLATFTCQVHNLNSGGLSASIWIPFLCYGWKLSPDNTLGNHRAHLICIPFLRSHCPVLPDMQCLKKSLLNIFYLILNFFYV